MKDHKEFTLVSGNKIPFIGFGPGILRHPVRNRSKHITGKIKNVYFKIYHKLFCYKRQDNKFVNSIVSAINNGFRLIDYSNAYGNMHLMARAIKECGVDRNDLFITVRVSNRDQENRKVRESILKTLEELNIGHIDLLQFHWPVPGYYVETWKEMIKLKEEGLVRVLGVANCHQHHLEMLERETGVLPEINQVEVHPLFTQKPLIDYCKSKDIIVEAYTPIARYDDRLVRLPLLKHLEEKYHKNFIQNGVIPVIRALNPEHQKSNIDIFDFHIDDDDMKKIDSININSRLRYDPDNCDFSIL